MILASTTSGHVCVNNKRIGPIYRPNLQAARGYQEGHQKLEETNIPMLAPSTIHAAIKDPEGKVDDAIANIYLNKQIDLYP
eukprot:11377759-Ditylum_brightwellii.AAC.1